MAVAGLGIACEPDFIVAPEIQSGRLVRFLGQFRPIQATIAAVYPSRHHRSAKARALVGFLAERLAQRADWSLQG